jgi:hypothetical protein
VASVVVNPVAPEILYIAVQKHGVFGTIDGGESWYQVDQASMDRRQRRFHSVNLNPHNPAEVWVAHFGSSFSKIVDALARDYLDSKFSQANLVRNGGFEEIDANSGLPRYWTLFQPRCPNDAEPVLSVVPCPVPGPGNALPGKRRGSCLRFFLGEAFLNAPSRVPADEEEASLIATGSHPPDPAWTEDPENAIDTRSWASQGFHPYFVFRARGWRVRIGMDVLVERRALKTWWLAWSESDEVERRPPELTLYEVRERGFHRVVAEARIDESDLAAGSSGGCWLHAVAEGRVSDLALGLVIVASGTGKHCGPMELYVGNVELKITGEVGTNDDGSER